jgi:dTDP-4-amino-4,6-dideoxygalactose transaminase
VPCNPAGDRPGQRRREIACDYRQAFTAARIDPHVLALPSDDPRDVSVYHQFVIYVANRSKMIAELASRGIETAVHYSTPIHLQPAYASLGHHPGDFPHAERACERVLSLPCHPWLTREQASYVANTVLEIVGGK